MNKFILKNFLCNLALPQTFSIATFEKYLSSLELVRILADSSCTEVEFRISREYVVHDLVCKESARNQELDLGLP
jgi:hypothetical protein